MSSLVRYAVPRAAGRAVPAPQIITPPAAAAPPARLTIARGNTQTAENAATTTLAVNKPADLADGDVIWTAVSAAGAVTVTKPSGSWVAAGEISGGTVVTVGLYYLVVGDAAAEPASYTWTISASGRLSLASTAYHNVDLTSPLDVAATTASSGTGVTSLDLPGQTTGTDGCVLVAACGNDSAGTALTVPGTMSQIFQSSGTGKRLATADETFATAGATGVRTFTQGASLAMAGVLAALRPALAAIAFPNAKDLAEGTGTRAFAAVTPRPGDYLLVQIGSENAVAGESYPPSGGGLTYTTQADSGTAGGASKARAIIATAPDSAGGQRTVTITPSNGARNYRARLTVVRTTLGPSGSGASDSAQTVSVARTGVDSGVAMQVIDWSAGTVGTPVWTPGGATVASQQGTGGTYVFGRWDASGAAGTASHGISSPSYTTPSVAALELLAGIAAGGASGAAAGAQRTAATTAAARATAGTAQGGTRVSGTTSGSKGTAGAAQASARTTGIAAVRKQAAATATGPQHTSGTAAGIKQAAGAASGQQHTAGVATFTPAGPSGAAAGAQRTTGITAGSKSTAGATAGQQHTAGPAAVRKQAQATAAGLVRTSGQATGVKSGQGPTAGATRMAGTTTVRKQADAAAVGPQRSAGAVTSALFLGPNGPARGAQRTSGTTAGRKGGITATAGTQHTTGVTTGTHRAVGATAGGQATAGMTAAVKGGQGGTAGAQRTAGLATFTTVPVPRWVEGAGAGTGLVEGAGAGTGQVELALAGVGLVEGSGGI